MQQSLISIIIPAYQEEKRIANTIESLSAYLNPNYPGTEIIVVCDGCTDNTARVAEGAFRASRCSIKVIELPKNCGKGSAIKVGVKEARGDFIIFTDADLSFAPNTIDEFLPKLKDGADVVIAQRKKTVSYPGLGRRILAGCSRFLVGNFLLPGIRDSQAGYKAFSREAAHNLFSRMRTSRFLFDLEILIIARHKKYRIEKVYVDWENRAGSTVRLVVDSIRSARDLIIIYFMSLSGQYD